MTDFLAHMTATFSKATAGSMHSDLLGQLMQICSPQGPGAKRLHTAGVKGLKYIKPKKGLDTLVSFT